MNSIFSYLPYLTHGEHWIQNNNFDSDMKPKSNQSPKHPKIKQIEISFVGFP